LQGLDRKAAAAAGGRRSRSRIAAAITARAPQWYCCIQVCIFLTVASIV